MNWPEKPWSGWERPDLGTTLYFTQMDPLDASMIETLARRDWTYAHLPFRRPLYLTPDWDPTGFDALILTSKRAAVWLLQQKLNQVPPLAVVGETSTALLKGLPLIFPTDPPTCAADLVARLQTFWPQPARLLFLRGHKASSTIVDGLKNHQAQQLTVYRTERICKKITALDNDSMVYFQAPSSVADYMDHYPKPPKWVGSIGPSTSEALRVSGWPVHFQPKRPENRHFVAQVPRPCELDGRK